MSQPPVSYKRHRFPPAIIAHAVWLHFRFPLSLRLVKEKLLERGIVVVQRDRATLGDEIRAGLRSPPPAQEAEPA